MATADASASARTSMPSRKYQWSTRAAPGISAADTASPGTRYDVVRDPGCAVISRGAPRRCTVTARSDSGARRKSSGSESIDAPAGAATHAPAAWHESAPAAEGGKDVLWRFTEPSRACRWLADFAAFDHDRVRVELVDAREGDALRDVTVKRFPTWGDAADLIDILDVRPDGERRYVSVAVADYRRPVVEGSQSDSRAQAVRATLS